MLLLKLRIQSEPSPCIPPNGFDAEKKAKRREEVFPLDCKKAFEMGVKFATETVE